MKQFATALCISLIFIAMSGCSAYMLKIESEERIEMAKLTKTICD